MNKYKRGDIGEEKTIQTILSDKSSYHLLINNLVLLDHSGMSHQIDHIDIRSTGIFVIETKNYFGEIDGSLQMPFWTKKVAVSGKVETSSFPSPLSQNKSHIRAIERVVGKNIPIFNFVVFAQDNINHLNIFNVCNLSSLLNRIYVTSDQIVLNSKQIDVLHDLLLKNEADVNQQAHLDNIHQLKENRKEKHNEIALAIEKRICPKCGNPISVKNNLIKCVKCDFKRYL